MTAIRELIEAVEAGWFPADMSGDQLHPGLAILTPYEAFNGSLDAALALMAAVLPGWDYRLERHEEDNFALVFLSGRIDYHVDDWEVSLVSPARALLLATLKAMEARG